MEQLLDGLGKIFTINLLRYFGVAGAAFFLFYMLASAKFIKSKIQTRCATIQDFIREIFYSVQTSLILAAVGVFVIYLSNRGYTLIYTDFSFNDWWYVPLSLLLSLIIHDTYFYWMHYLLHRPKFFKYTHRLHHKSITPSPWASYSFHFLEAIAEGLVLVIIAFILPLHHITVLLFVFIGFAINVYGHLGYEIMPKWFRHSWLFELSNSSVFHNLHHRSFNGNYGLYFRWWDRWMRTELPNYVSEYDCIQKQRFEDSLGCVVKQSIINARN